MTIIELARDIIDQVHELITSVEGGVNLSTMHPDDGFIHAIAQQIDEFVETQGKKEKVK